MTFRDGSGSALSSSAKDWVFLHQGGERIAAGDYEFRNRVYSPSLGRWLSNDPLGFEAGDQNWYRSIGNNPGNGEDPEGLVVIFIHGKPGFSKPANINVNDPEVAELYRFETNFGKVKHFAYTDLEAAEKYILGKIRIPENKDPKEPVIIIGHSAGGATGITLSENLIKKGYKIDLLATLDPFIGNQSLGISQEKKIPPEVKIAWNWRQTVEFPKGGRLTGPTTQEIENPKFPRPDPKNPGKIKDFTPGHREMDDTPPIAIQIKKEILKIEENFINRR